MEMDRSSHTNVTTEKDGTVAIASSNKNGSPGGVHHEEERQIPTNNKEGLQPVVEVAEMSYQEYSIKIYSVGAQNNKFLQFFFEPIVVLDPKSVIILSQELFQEKKVIQFTILMWTADIRTKVVELLRRDNPEIKEKDVRVMPYENVRLVGKPESIHPSVTIMEEATSYRRQNEKLNFFVLCDSPTTSEILAENLRSCPEFVVRKWQLEIECRGMALNSSVTDDTPSAMMRPLCKFIVSTVPVVGQGNK